MKTRTTLLATVSLLAMMATAPAADLLKGPRPMPLPVASWAGGYIGGSVGFGRYSWDMRNSGTEFGVCHDTTERIFCTQEAVHGGLAGVQIGYNFQSGALVYGVEADWMWTGFSEKRSAHTTEIGWTYNSEMDWIATFRGRMGLAVDRTMAYVTAGFAVANTTSGYTANYVCCGERRIYGWVAGVGVEHMFNPRWSVKGEFLYHSFVKDDTSVQLLDTGGDPGTYNNKFTHEVFTVKLGLNYKLPW
jgi:outer membrane immunogenic protein